MSKEFLSLHLYPSDVKLQNLDSSKSVYLDWYCLLNEHRGIQDWKKKEEFCLPKVFFTYDERITAMHDVEKHANALVEVLPLWLEEKYQKDFLSLGYRYWKTLTLLWANYLMSIYVFRQEQIAVAMSTFEHTNIETLLAPKLDWRFLDVKDFFFRGASNPIFHWYICSRIIEEKKPSNWHIAYTTQNEVERLSRKFAGVLYVNTLAETHRSWMSRIKNIIKDSLKNFIPNDCEGVFGINLVESMLFSVLLRGRNLLKSDDARADVDSMCRTNYPDKDKNTAHIHDRLNVYRDNILSFLPHEYLAFSSNQLALQDAGNQKQDMDKESYVAKKQFVISGPNSGANYTLAEKVRKGKNVIFTQHGGCEGCFEHLSFSNLEYQDHAYITWGWEREDYMDEHTMCMPLPSPYMSKIANSYSKKNNTLLYINDAMYLPECALLPAMRSSHENILYRETTIQFFDRLRDEILNNSVYRSYKTILNVHLEHEQYVLEHFPKLSLLESHTNSAICSSKLTVLGYPGTSFAIAMAANAPIVMFFNPKVYRYSKNSETLWKKLEAVGIVHTSVEGAVEFINQNWEQITRWWDSPSVQSARIEWCNVYAKFDKNWRRKWVKAIWNLS